MIPSAIIKNGILAYKPVPSGPTDPLFPYVTSLLHFDGSLTDQIPGRTWTNDRGTITTSGTPAIVGTGSLKINSTGASIKSTTPFNPGTGDFCVQFKWRFTGSALNYVVLWEETISTNSYSWQVYTNGGQTGIYWSSSTQGDHGSNTFNFADGVRHEIAIDRYNGVVKIYLDGTAVNTVTDGTNYNTATSQRIANEEANGYDAIGFYLDEFRQTKRSRFNGASSYTVSYDPFPNS